MKSKATFLSIELESESPEAIKAAFDKIVPLVDEIFGKHVDSQSATASPPAEGAAPAGDQSTD